jgi:PKHD-type hydroxylase
MAFTYTIEPQFLTKEECDIILNFSLENLTLVPSEIIHNGKDDVTNSDLRKSNQVFYPYYKKFPFLLEKMSKLLNKYISVKGFDLDFKHSEFQFTEYKEGDHFGWHKDIYAGKIKNEDRYCSLVILLNDNYEDGNLQLKNPKDKTITVERGTGNLVLFLSDIEHRVQPIKSGIRYTLVNWVGVVINNNFKKTLL